MGHCKKCKQPLVELLTSVVCGCSDVEVGTGDTSPHPFDLVPGKYEVRILEASFEFAPTRCYSPLFCRSVRVEKGPLKGLVLPWKVLPSRSDSWREATLAFKHEVFSFARSVLGYNCPQYLTVDIALGSVLGQQADMTVWTRWSLHDALFEPIAANRLPAGQESEGV